MSCLPQTARMDGGMKPVQKDADTAKAGHVTSLMAPAIHVYPGKILLCAKVDIPSFTLGFFSPFRQMAMCLFHKQLKRSCVA